MMAITTHMSPHNDIDEPLEWLHDSVADHILDFASELFGVSEITALNRLATAVAIQASIADVDPNRLARFVHILAIAQRERTASRIIDCELALTTTPA